MHWVVAAKLVMLSHFAFVAFVFLGPGWLDSRRTLLSLHAPCLVYAALATVIAWPCPLTVLEQWLLARGGAPVYSGEFLPHYVWSRFGLAGTEVQVAAGTLVALAAASAPRYWVLLRSARP